MSLSVGVAKIFATDVSNLSKKLRASQKRGVRFRGSPSAALCELTRSKRNPVFRMQGNDIQRLYPLSFPLQHILTVVAADDDYVMFFCGHIYHKECLLDPEAIEAINASRVRGIKQSGVANKIMEAMLLKPYLMKGCEVCGVLEGTKKGLDKGKGVARIAG